MAVLRASEGPVGRSAIEAAWDDPIQRERALDGLVADGLVWLVGPDRFGLPGGAEPGGAEPGQPVG
jgi:A/G-specific adenine glycosylase